MEIQYKFQYKLKGSVHGPVYEKKVYVQECIGPFNYDLGHN